MTQHDALLAAVCAAPDDDLPRLVYADWCDENGDPDRAEFIRVQIEIANGAKGEKLAKLQEREKRLFDEHRETWTESLQEFKDENLSDPLRFRRGFVESVSVSGVRFEEHGDKLFRLAPIRGLWLGDEDELDSLSQCKHLLRISSLELTGSRLGDVYHGSAKFFGSEVLANLATLIARGVDDNGHLDSGALWAIVESKHLGKLHTLDIGGNWLFNVRDDRETEAVTSVLLQLGTLHALTNLYLDELWMDGIVIEQLSAQPWLQRLIVLDLHRNHAGDLGGRAVADSPNLTRIQHLDLRENGAYTRESVLLPVSDEVKQLLKRRFGERVLV